MRLVRGCHDILPASAHLRHHLKQHFIRAASLRCCVPIETPVLEYRDVFSSLGDASDINQHETFSIADTSPQVVLRPEGTAGIGRSMHKLLRHSTTTNRLWYVGPMFRRERPQAGRHRQFTQLGVEFLGGHSVDDDFDAIELAHSFLSSLTNVRLRIHSLGTPAERIVYNDQLSNYLFPHMKDMPKQARYKIESGNSLRLLDEIDFHSNKECDNKLDHVLRNAPRLWDFLSDQSKKKFDLLCAMLNQADIPFVVDHTLVRGLDYYAGIIFEIDAEDNNWVLGGGGRYTLANLGDMQGVGFALGVERIEALLSNRSTPSIPPVVAPIPIVALGPSASPQHAAARNVVSHLRQSGVAAFVQLAHTTSGAAKDRSSNTCSRLLSKVVANAGTQGAAAVVVIGSDDVAKGVAHVKPIVQNSKQSEVQHPFTTPAHVAIDRVHEVVRDIVNTK